ncbi:MAG: adenylate/guanylate cyclase domain-containing protein [Bacteroidetes bacterium]|nr:adenylate/guanylate cyclase domain-containing protein [Bacteroidota bacterium]
MPLTTGETIKKFFFTKPIRAAASVLIALLLTWWLSFSSLGKSIELNALDIQFNLARNSRATDTSIVILTIDQNSLQYFKNNGKITWPWPRDFYALVTRYLHEAGAKAIVYDFHFNEPDIDRVNSQGKDNDELFSESIKEAGNVFLSVQLTTQDDQDQPGDSLLKFPVHPANVAAKEIPEFNKSYAPLISFQQASQGIGVVNFTPDQDGICRRIPLVYSYDGKQLFTLSYEIFSSLESSFSSKKLTSPFLVYWYGKGGPDGVFKYYSIHAVIVSALKIMQGEQPDLSPSIFKNKIVLIGSNAPGLLDIRATPFTSEEPYPGVEIHATALSNFTQHHFIKEMSSGTIIGICIFLALIVSLLSNYLENILFSTFSVLLVIGVFLFSVTYFFKTELTWIKVVAPVSSALLTYIISVGWNFATEGRSKRQIQKIFGQFVNPHVVKQLSRDPEHVELGGEEVEATIMFSDIEGFTSISETKKPKELVAFLNNYFSAANDVFFKHDGTIDKFIGDAVMVQFGIPLKNSNHRLLAARAAYEFSRLVYEMNAEARTKNQPVFSTRIGINSGPMVAGYIGGRSKKEYTVIGDTVNLASRLEGVNKFYGTSIMVSEATADHIGDEFILREMDLIRVKGKKMPIKIYELVCKREEATEDTMKMVQTFESALQLYRHQQWRDAVSMFTTIQKLKGNDPPSKEYITRCIDYEQQPPGKDWDGVHIMTSK